MDLMNHADFAFFYHKDYHSFFMRNKYGVHNTLLWDETKNSSLRSH
jgi:hypothetical protein